ncbi:MAG: LysM peptidoglycan-binding domain-containing protein [Spirochaetaceae bacterium]
MKKLLIILLIFVIPILTYAETITHSVIKGDTLYGIAKLYNITTDTILLDNNLKSENLNINQKLLISSLKPDEYRVRSGDSLSNIAYNSDITLKHLLLANNIKEDYKIQIGEILILPIPFDLKKTYKVKKGDTLSWISMTYSIESEKVIKLNNIKNDNLVIGQVLNFIDDNVKDPIKIKQASVTVPLIKLAPKTDTSLTYTIQKSDTISAIALEYQTSIDDILKINNFTNDKIRIGEKIKLPAYAKKREPIDYNFYHTVIKGDTISGLSVLYDISETLLRELNNFTKDNISIGQKIKLIPPESRSHKVIKGDTLWSIAQKYNVSLDQLMQYNHLNSTLVAEGKVLSIYDYSVVKHVLEEKNSNINLVSLKYTHNTTESQPYKNYSIDELKNPLEKYNTAKENWNKFSTLIANESPISNDLEGWTVILDPGHGGKDPGAIASVIQNGKQSFIVEDEYAYDTAVRLYELLKRNGAKAYMTILSPDHIARNPKTDTTTFINEKNEVYNNYKLNKINNNSIWPVGGQWGLDQRVLITNNILSSVPSKKTLFISLHADNDVDRGKGKLILFSDRYGRIDTESKGFAQQMIKDMGSGTITKGMSLAVLDKNNADYKMLIELRNMAHISEAMALLDNETRQNDALMILNGIKRATLFSK